jgi:putative methylase
MTKSEDKVRSKKALAVLLSSLKGFESPKVRVEQYTTDAEIAAEVLWYAGMKGDIGKVSVDLGCGPGILGFGLLALGAEKVYFVDSDQEVMDVARENMAKIESERKGPKRDENVVFLCKDIKHFNEQVDLVFMNPPFGTKVRHNDKIFLEKAFEISKVIYSFHKTETKKFVEVISKDKNFKITDVFDFRFPLNATMKFHSKKIKNINVSCFRMEKETDLSSRK